MLIVYSLMVLPIEIVLAPTISNDIFWYQGPETGRLYHWNRDFWCSYPHISLGSEWFDRHRCWITPDIIKNHCPLRIFILICRICMVVRRILGSQLIDSWIIDILLTWYGIFAGSTIENTRFKTATTKINLTNTIDNIMRRRRVISCVTTQSCGNFY